MSRRAKLVADNPDPERMAMLGWGNALAEIGPFDIKSRQTRHFRSAPVSVSELEAIYSGNAMAKRIVDRPADDAIREGFTLEKLPKMVQKKAEDLYSAIEDYGLLEHCGEADKEARLYGGALLIPLTDGDGSADTEFKLERVRKLKGFEIVASPDAYPADPTALGTRGVRRPERYRIYGDRLVHSSRCIRFEGAKAPTRMMRELNGWYFSELNAPYDNLRRLGSTRAYMEAIMHNISLPVMKIAGLGKKLLGGSEAKAKVRAMVRELQQQADNNHWLALDKEDGYDVSSRPVEGLQALASHFVDAVVSDTDIPREILLGQTPGGLNTGSNAGAFQSYYDWVSARRKKRYTRPMVTLLDLLFQVERVAVKRYTIGWPALWTPTPAEQASTRQALASGDATYVSMGAVPAEVIRDWRAAQGILPPRTPGEVTPAPPEPTEPEPEPTEPADE